MRKRPSNFIQIVQHKVAISAIGPSALRNQGKGVIWASREFLANIALGEIPLSGPKSFCVWLDSQTEALLDTLPIQNRPWGAARKAINLFLRDSLYNQYLSENYKLNRLEAWLEIPLDSAVARGLKLEDALGYLPKWCGLKFLQPEKSERYQNFALKQAKSRNIERIHLDMYLWLDNR